jgi:hypothetical protein
MRRPASRARRHTASLAFGVAAVGALVALSAAPAIAGGGVVGDPQPELARFTVDPAGGGTGSGAVLPDGNLVLAAPNGSGSNIRVCVLHPGSRACVSTATLVPYSGGGGDSFSGTAEVLATGGDDVSVVTEDCCYLDVGGDNGGAVVFDSTNGGASFSVEHPAGTIQGISAATYADGQIVVADSESGGLNVQAFPVDPSTAETAIATPRGGDVGTSSLTTYDGGVLLAADDTTNTHVQYATSDFNASGSWSTVGTFGNELVSAASGNALLTDPGGSLTGGERLRFFTGSSFGAASKVPDSAAGDDGYFTMQEVGRDVHVFFIGRRDSYDAFEESTTDGTHWSGLDQYTMGSAIDAGSLAAVLGPTGAGLLFENDGTPLTAQPVLNAQGVHVTLTATKVKVGHTTTLRGTATPRLPGQLVTLEREDAGKWYAVSTTHETSSGTFSFVLPAVTRTYRAVVNLKPGYDEYGYSNAATVTAIR